jgi:hypothetical protein
MVPIAGPRPQLQVRMLGHRSVHHIRVLYHPICCHLHRRILLHKYSYLTRRCRSRQRLYFKTHRAITLFLDALPRYHPSRNMPLHHRCDRYGTSLVQLQVVFSILDDDRCHCRYSNDLCYFSLMAER